MSDLPYLKDFKPPWVVFPELEASELSRYLKQGVTEAWFDQHWRPFWSGLSLEERHNYLTHWEATPAWREALSFFFASDEDFDLDSDARDSEQYLKEWRHNKGKTK
jgi:hypothetical protein